MSNFPFTEVQSTLKLDVLVKFSNTPIIAPDNFRATFTSETTITFSWNGVTRQAESIIDVNMYLSAADVMEEIISLQ